MPQSIEIESLPPEFESVEFKHLGCKFTMQLLAAKDSEYYPSGSAVLINSQIAVTARHVIDDFLYRYQGCKLSNDVNAVFNLVGLSIGDDSTSGALWNVKRVMAAGFTDCAILHIEPRSDAAKIRRNVNLRINPIPPKPGTRVTAMGYKSPKFGSDAEKLSIRIDPTVTTGTVLDIFLENRNSKARDPCMAVGFRSEGSMSGGPVFDESGCLCGIISSSFDTKHGEKPTSFCSLIHPILGMVLDIDRFGYAPGAKYRFFELAQQGFVNIASLEDLELEGDCLLMKIPADLRYL